MENQDIDLLGQTVGNMPYKIGIVDKDGKVTNQFVAKASTNRIDIPESSLGTGGSASGQLSTATNLFSGSAFGNVLLSGPSANYDNVQDGLLITFDKFSLEANHRYSGTRGDRINLSSTGLKPIKIPKEKLVVNSSFDISDQLSQYIGKSVKLQYQSQYDYKWSDANDVSIVGFKETAISVLPNTTLSVNLTMTILSHNNSNDDYQIPVSQVNTYKD